MIQYCLMNLLNNDKDASDINDCTHVFNSIHVAIGLNRLKNLT